MRANTNGLAAFQDNDLVRISDGADALCNDQQSAVFYVFCKRTSERGIGREVESREAVIEYVYLCIYK